jgi:hypothetical protein
VKFFQTIGGMDFPDLEAPVGVIHRRTASRGVLFRVGSPYPLGRGVVALLTFIAGGHAFTVFVKNYRALRSLEV